MKSEIYFPKEDSYFFIQILEKHIPKFLNQKPNSTLLEMGSGSGIHLESLSRLGIKKQNIFSCDINPLSVRHCKKLGFSCVHSDLFSNIKDLRLPSEAIKEVAFPRREGRLSEGNLKGRLNVKETLVSLQCPSFDLIIFNPPYLPKNSSEPENSRVATTGGILGSEVINEFLRQARHYLNENGKIFLLTSSLSGKIDFLDYNKKILAKKKLFFEELIIWEMMIL